MLHTNHSTFVRKGLTLVELLIVLLISGGIFSAVFCTLSEEQANLNAYETVHRINNMTKTAYDVSVKLDEANDWEALMNDDGFSVVKTSGTWYMLCDLHTITGGNKKEQKIIQDTFSKNKGLTPGDAAASGYVSMFLRISTAKNIPPSDSKGDFVNIYHLANEAI
ncbi:MAG: prepilin-type N-terminal cleavage/methylation domain-containing protein [Synergistaceae bacterium]|nr:prepilin-type N-terminal cleavage/methylation domain-containing protein [Synergistaceae bacterium]